MNCSVCDGQSDKVFTYGEVPLCDAYMADPIKALGAKRYPIDLYACGSCGHLELATKPPEREIYSEYIYRSSHSPDLSRHFDSYATEAASALPMGSNALDIGCNDGLLLDALMAHGFKTYGIEPSPAAEDAKSRGHNVVRGYLSEASVEALECDSYRLITINNVLANVRDLHAFTQVVCRALSPDGILVIETLCSAVLLRRGIFEMFNHEHYHYFSLVSLQKLLIPYGLSLQSAEFFATKGGTMRLTFSRQSAKLIQGASLFSPTSDDLNSFQQRILIETSTIQRFLSNTDKPPVVFGSYAGTTINSHVLFPNVNFTLIIDDNFARFGLYSPGTGAQCVSPNDCPAGSPIIISAWRFAHQILNKHAGLFSRHPFYVINGKNY
jgi:2-polyprenyl-3-methyl-5-hydroxy-6-metoxy-1,4-benzoquinol methylase